MKEQQISFGSLKTLVLIISVETYVDYLGGTLKIFDGGVPFFGFQWQPAAESLTEKDTRL